MATGEMDPNVVKWRLDNQRDRLQDVEDWRRDVDRVLASDEQWKINVQAILKANTDAVKRNTQMLIGFALTIAISALGLALTILSSSGKI